MAIEIRELVIKVKIEESVQGTSERLDIEKIKQLILKECKKEIKRELNRKKEMVSGGIPLNIKGVPGAPMGTSSL